MTAPPEVGSRVRARLSHDTLILYAEDEPTAFATALAAALPGDDGRIPVLCTAAVSARPDLFALLPDLLCDHLGGSADGLRLVPLGAYADPDAVPGLAASLAADLGLDLAVPLDAPAMFAGAEPAGVEWVIADGTSVRREPPRVAWSAGPAHGDWFLKRAGSGYALLPTRPPGGRAASAQAPEPERAPEPAPDERAGRAAVEPPVGRPIPGGWSFRDEPLPDGPAAPGFLLVEVEVGEAGFRIGGADCPTEVLAGHLAGLPGREPVVLRAADGHPDGAGESFAVLAEALGRPVIAADGVVLTAATGLLTTPGAFRRWWPAGPLGPMPAEDLGRVLPPMPRPTPDPPILLATPMPAPIVAACVVEPAAVAESEPAREIAAVSAVLAELLTATHPPAPRIPQLDLRLMPAVPRLEPEPEPESVPAVARRELPEVGRVPIPMVVQGRVLTAADRPALRRILAGRYDAYSRVASSILAEEPGLRVASMTAPDLLGGLIAVRAYGDAERDPVNRVLRDTADADADAAVLARWVAYGLHRLPAVFGPVFRLTGELPLDAYRPGTVLIEPAFLDVELVRRIGEAGGAELVIWSAGARRMGRLAAGERAVFPAGTRFEVLGVDASDARLHLRELAARGASGDGARTLARLRDAAPAVGDPVLEPLTFAPGLDAAGRFFDSPAEPETTSSVGVIR